MGPQSAGKELHREVHLAQERRLLRDIAGEHAQPRRPHKSCTHALSVQVLGDVKALCVCLHVRKSPLELPGSAHAPVRRCLC